LKQNNETNDLQKGAGEMDALNGKGNFDGLPHLVSALAQAYPKMPRDAQPFAANLVQQIKSLPTYVRPSWVDKSFQGLPGLIARQLAELQRRLSAA